jgi:hypothetical protein
MQRDWWIVWAAILGIIPFSLITLSIMSFGRGRRDYKTGRYWGMKIAAVATLASALFSKWSTSPFSSPTPEGLFLVAVILFTVCMLSAYIGERRGRKEAEAWTRQKQTEDTQRLPLSEPNVRIEPVSESGAVNQKMTTGEIASIHDTEDATKPIADEQELEADKGKRCPYCAEEIQSAALKCRYCGEWLSGLEVSQDIS